ncbi:MAG: murein biosynthesis integral membrane protein MurJ, partial [Nitrospirae bacterium]
MAKETITRGAGAFSSATGLSRVLGFVRDMLLANFLGASGSSDAFFVAFRIPNLLRELFAEGSMSAAVVPVLTEAEVKEGPERARIVVKKLFTFLLVSVGLICILAEFFAPIIVKAIAPGFKGQQFALTVLLSRIMFVFLLFVSLSALLMGALNVRKVFFVPAMASAWFNVTTIVVLLVLILAGVSPLVAASVAIVCGGFMQFFSQVPTFMKKGYRFGIELRFSDPYLKRMALLWLPTLAGLAVTQLNIFVSTIIASFLPHGSITYLYYAMRLIQLPIGMFGVAVAVTSLATLSEHASR